MNLRKIAYPLIIATTFLLNHGEKRNYGIFESHASKNPRFYGKGEEIIECVERNLPKIFARQRRILEARDSVLPKVTYGPIDSGYHYGNYYSHLDLIKLDTSYLDPKFCKDAIIHENTHAYMNRLSREMGNGNWPTFSNARNFTYEDIGIKLVGEGIAEYMENRGKVVDSIKEWPSNAFLLYTSLNFYTQGYHLVKPLLDKYGAESVRPMILRPPQGEEVFHPEQWQDTIRARIKSMRN